MLQLIYIIENEKVFHFLLARKIIIQPFLCHAAKNGVYTDLVNNVREAFEECELVRINCQGLNASDYRKIGAKLKVR